MLERNPAPKAAQSEAVALVLNWPAEERGWAKLTIDGQEQPIPQSGEIRYPLPPRPAPYSIVLSRVGYQPQQFTFTSAADQPVAPYQVQWKTASHSASPPSAPVVVASTKSASADGPRDSDAAKVRQDKPTQYDNGSKGGKKPRRKVAPPPKADPVETPVPAPPKADPVETPVPPPQPDAAPKPAVVPELVGARMDLTLSSGETLSNRQVLRVSRGKDENTVVSVTLADDSTGKPMTVVGARIREISMPGGKPLLVYDLACKALVPPEQLAGRRPQGTAAGGPAEKGPAVKPAVAATGRPADSDEDAPAGRWPEITDEEQRLTVEKQRETLTQIDGRVPNMGMKLYETKRFLFYSDIQAQFVNTIYVPYLDQMYTQLCTAYGIDPGKNIWKGKATIIAFAQQRSFHQYEAAFFQPLPSEDIRGLAHLRGDGTVLISCYAYDSPATLGGVMVHETVHGFNFRHKSPRQLPSWLDEGIAEWVADQVVVGNKSVRRKVERAIQQMRTTRSLGGNFFDADHIDAWQYGVSASMVGFLLKYNPPPPTGKSTARNRSAKQSPLCFRKFVEAIKDGTPWPDALAQTYGFTIADLARSYGQVIGVPGLGL